METQSGVRSGEINHRRMYSAFGLMTQLKTLKTGLSEMLICVMIMAEALFSVYLAVTHLTIISEKSPGNLNAFESHITKQRDAGENRRI